MAKKSRKSQSINTDSPRPKAQGTKVAVSEAEGGLVASTAQSAETADTGGQRQILIVGIGMSAGELEACKKFLTAMPLDSGVAVVLVPHPDPNHESMMATLLGRRTETEYQFHCYRRNMVLRRIQRRMEIRQIQQFADYLKYIRVNPQEIQLLCDDLLISVTGFFRDPAVFQDLETKVIPTLIQRHQSQAARQGSESVTDSLSNEAENSVRVWVPACATGEEAYSIAMLLFERFSAEKLAPDFQLYATDVNDDALETARQGIYPDAAMGDVSSDRLKQFFVRADEHHFRVSKKLRESVVFARHNLISDAPFSKLDFLACRNLLIYLEPEVQQKVIALFHFSLRQDGYLMLGGSETIGRAVDLFAPVSKKSRIYRRTGPRRHDLMELPIVVSNKPQDTTSSPRPSPRQPIGFIETLNRFLLKKYAPASVLITRRYEILSQQGPLANYLEFPSGEPTHDLLAMARQGLATKIRAAVHDTLRTGQPTVDEDSHVKLDGAYGRCRVTVTPVNDLKEADGLLLVTFEELAVESTSQPMGDGNPAGATEASLVDQLQHELKATTEDLQSTIEELENANEELTRVNSQLQEKVQELDQANCDVSNLMVSADIATLFLDDQLCLQRFTTPAARLLNLRDTDIGRPFRDFVPTLHDESLPNDCRRVLRERSFVEKEVWSLEPQTTRTFESTAGQTDAESARRCYLRRIVPYRSGDQSIQGVVITLLDITSRIESEAEARKLATVLRDSNDAVMVLDLNGQITTWNAGAAHLYGYMESEALQLNILDIVPDEEQETMRAMLVQIRGGRHVDSFESKRTTKDGRVLDVWLTVTVLTDNRNRPAFAATTERDVTSRTQQGKDHAKLDALRSAEHYKSAEELRAILDATIDAVITINQQGIMVRINAATERLFGYGSHELIGQNVRILMTSPDRENHDGYIQHYLETKEARIIGIGREVRCQRKDGSIFHGELSINEVDHLGLFTGMIRDISERRRLQNEILRAVSEEQRRIGQDLHDTAGQDLAGLAYLIKSHLAFLEESTGKESFSDSSGAWMSSELITMRNTSDAILGLQRKIRTVIRGLAPVDVSGDGLMAALTDLTAGIRELHHIRCDFLCAKPILLNDNQLATHLYRIAQEAINNGIRHGGASEISVSLEESDGCIILTIHDDGCGIDFKQLTENGGFGLHIMNYRANLMGAKCSIQPGRNGGTTVCCRLPRSESGAQ